MRPPCQLPIPLLERVVLTSSDPGDIILDPFLGTGTTAIAAKALGRHFIGIDLDTEYIQIAHDKITRIEPSRWNGFYVSQYLGKVQSIRHVDAAKTFPPQLTSTEKKRLRANGERLPTSPVAETARLLDKSVIYATRAPQ